MKSALSPITTIGALFGLSALILVIGAFIIPLPVAFSPLVSTELQALDISGVTVSMQHIWSAVRFTLLQASASTVLAFLIGFPAAFLVARRNFFLRRFLASLSAVPLAIPPILIALAFVLFYGRMGILNQFFMSVFSLKEPPITFLYSFWGIIITHGFYNFPVIMRIVSDVWTNIPGEQSDAARLLGASEWRIFRTITVFQLAPAIGAGITMVFLYCFFSFVIVMLFGSIGGTTIEIEIFQAARTNLQFRTASIFAVIEMVIAIFFVSIYAWFQKKVSQRTSSIRHAFTRINLIGKKEKTATTLYILFLCIFFLGPLLALIMRSLQSGVLLPQHIFSSYNKLFSKTSFLGALQNTIVTGLATATVSTAAATTFAVLQKNISKKKFALFTVFPLLPLAVSSIVMGLGWIILIPRGNVFILILAQSSVAWVFALRYISAHMEAIPQSIIDASRLLSPNPLYTVFKIYIPLAKRGIITAFCFAFAISAGDATLPLMLSVYKYETLSLYIYRLAGSYQFTEACACGVVLALLIGITFFAGDTKPRHIHTSKNRKRT